MQRLRDFGTTLKEIDLLDESRLTSEQIRSIVSILLGGNKDSYPHPDVDMDGFKKVIQEKLNQEVKTWCPLKKRMMPWIRLNKIKPEKCSIM